MNIDEAFDAYLDTPQTDLEYGDFEGAIKRAFKAGYLAAGGTLPQRQPVLRLINNDKQNR